MNAAGGSAGGERVSVDESDAPAERLPSPKLRHVEPVAAVDAGFLGSYGFYLRLTVLGLVAAVTFGVLALRLWSLQVLHVRYAGVAERQATRIVVRPGARGPIVDRRDRLLADVGARLVVTLDARALGSAGPAAAWRPTSQGRTVLRRLAALTGDSPGGLVRRVRQALARSPFVAPIVVPRLPRLLSFYLDERRDRFPGLRVEALPARRYPQGAAGGEFLGLVGEIGPAQLEEPRYRGYRPGELIGRSGIEASYDRLLRGGFQRARVSVDALGRPLGVPRPLGRSGPPGGLRLTIDMRLQRAAERAVEDGIRLAHAAGHPDADAGAAVVLDPRSGAVYALASVPGFNQVAAAGDSRYLARLLAPTNQRRPLLDRATQGLYPAGSTFKPIVAEAALESGLISPSTVLPCTGSLTVGNTVFHNVEPGINASLALPQALEISCDTWFYRLGVSFYGSLELQRWARRLGIGRPTGIDLPGEARGVLPTPAWVRRAFPHDRWRRRWWPGDSVNLSIGQGLLLVTPLQLAVAYAVLANGGTIVRPHLGDAVLSASGRVLRRLHFPPRGHVRLAGLAAIRDGLYRASHDPGGTSAALFARFPVPVAGKTGTAQAPGGSDHSWYASWAPAGRPRVVVVVLVEHGGFGAEAAAPAAREIYRAFFRLRRSPRG